MENYSPSYLGKVIPADDPAKMTDFCTSQYEAFTKVYEVCKDLSEHIADIAAVESDSKDPGSLSVKVFADPTTVEMLKEATKDDVNVSINGDVITAKKPNQ